MAQGNVVMNSNGPGSHDSRPNGSQRVAVTKAWEVISRWLKGSSDDIGAWWHIVGPHVATMVHEANYSSTRQFDALLFLYSLVLPQLGKAPSAHGSNWRSLLTNDGSPLEYSWKWNSTNGSPEIRYCIEAIGDRAGSRTDPLNVSQTRDMLLQLAPLLPKLDLTWFDHFRKSFHLDGDAKSLQLQDPISSTFVAFEHLDDGVMVKTYFLPTGDSHGGSPTFATFADAVRMVSPNTSALDELMAFVSADKYGAALSPDMLAIDCVSPAKSRLKLYVGSPRTCFEGVRTVMTLGGRVAGVDKALNELAELFRLVLGLKEGFSWQEDLSVQNPFDAALAHEMDLYSNMTYYFDIAPGAATPDVKLYIPVIRYGRSDDDVATGLKEFLNSRDRGQYVHGFKQVLRELESRHPPANGHRVQTFIACALQGDSLSMTSYLNPGIYHPQLKAK